MGVIGIALSLWGCRVAIFEVGMIPPTEIVCDGVRVIFSLWLAKKNSYCIGLRENFFFMESRALISGMCKEGADATSFD